jgi:hypothetical protein
MEASVTAKAGVDAGFWPKIKVEEGKRGGLFSNSKGNPDEN